MPGARVDLVCVGGGLAGLAGAARAAELGLKVVVLEQGTDARYPCNSRYSAGVFHASYMDVTLPADTLLAAMRKATEGHADDALLETVANHAGRALEWFRAQGARFLRDAQRRWVMAPPRSMRTGLEWEGRGADVVMRALTTLIERSGGRVELGARAHRLITQESRCTGVVADRGGVAFEVHAQAVLLADGGFQGNRDLVRRHIAPRAEDVFPRGADNARGDGLAMALAAGAALTPLDRFYGHLLSRDAFSNDDLWPFPQVDAVAAAGIMVDRDGLRLFDEGLGGIYLANRLAAHPDPLCATVICDTPIWESAGREHQIPPNPSLETHRGTLWRAPTLDALAAMAGLPAERFRSTVEQYNAAAENGRTETLSPPRSVERGRPRLIGTPPFIAISVCSGITNTMGGIRIDTHGRVLDAGGSAIAGLYCAGASAGGLEGGPQAGYVGGLVRSLFGLRAAEHLVASYLPSLQETDAP